MASPIERILAEGSAAAAAVPAPLNRVQAAALAVLKECEKGISCDTEHGIKVKLGSKDPAAMGEVMDALGVLARDRQGLHVSEHEVGSGSMMLVAHEDIKRPLPEAVSALQNAGTMMANNSINFPGSERFITFQK